MTWRFIVLLGCSLGCASPDGGEAAHSGLDTMFTVTSDSLDRTVEQAAGAFFEAAPQSVGLSVSVVSRNGIRTYHFGSVEPAGPNPPTDQTVYAIASATKTITGSLLARAIHEGRLSLRDDIRDYLIGSYPNLEVDHQPVEVAHLLTHTSGLPRLLPDRPEMSHTYAGYENDPILWMSGVEAILSDYTQTDFYHDLRAVRLDTIPGSRYAYSNAGVHLAGFILEQVYGRPLDVLVDSLLACPIGMESTGFEMDVDQRVDGYDDQGRRMPRDLTASGAAGGLLSTPLDLARYVQWHLDESDPVVELSHTPPGSDSQRALGWHVLQSSSGVRRIATDGTVPGFHSRMVLYPDLEIGIVILVNQLDASTPPLTDELANTVLDVLDERAFAPSEAL